MKEHIDGRSIMQCSFANDNCRSLLNTVIGTVKEFVESSVLQGVFYFLSDVLRLAFGLLYYGSLLVVDEHASH
jgi:hypothetical protein